MPTRRSRSGLPLDLAEFCEAEWPRLVGTLSLYTGDRDLAQELAQETVAQICCHWQRVKAMPQPRGWVHRVAINIANSHFRQRRAAHRAGERRELDETHVDEDLALVVAVRTAVQRLPAKERAVILLRFFVGLSVRETADALKIPEGTVKSATSRAVALLRALIGDDVEVTVDG